jgi:16S rRNA A1518/A1519 N6-dimethyltransferase RsmA/KsgA/DIM1 with predicted DNA glycosylase/AP lyase activity
VPAIREKLPPLLAGVRRSILEIGAGTGLITTSMADWTPAEIFALEPSAGMRGILLSRLSSRPELLERVTVLACDALSVELDGLAGLPGPGRCRGFERSELPAGRRVVGDQWPSSDATVTVVNP